MENNKKYDIVANAIRIEFDKSSGDIFVVFKIIDDKLKKQIRESWSKEIPLQIIGYDLIIKEK